MFREGPRDPGGAKKDGVPKDKDSSNSREIVPRYVPMIDPQTNQRSKEVFIREDLLTDDTIADPDERQGGKWLGLVNHDVHGLHGRYDVWNGDLFNWIKSGYIDKDGKVTESGKQYFGKKNQEYMKSELSPSPYAPIIFRALGIKPVADGDEVDGAVEEAPVVAAENMETKTEVYVRPEPLERARRRLVVLLKERYKFLGNVDFKKIPNHGFLLVLHLPDGQKKEFKGRERKIENRLADFFNGTNDKKIVRVNGKRKKSAVA